MALADVLAWPDRQVHVIAEAFPSRTPLSWAAADMGSPATVYVTAHATSWFAEQIPGGVYLPVVGVREDNTDLEAVDSVEDVQSTPGSWYWDADNGLLYVHSTDGASPDTHTVYQVFVRVHWATTGLVLNHSDDAPETGIYYHPWITEASRAGVEEIGDGLFGIRGQESATLVLAAGHGVLHRFLALDGEWMWKRKRVRLLVGGSARGVTLPYSEYEPLRTMLVDDVGIDDQEATLILRPVYSLLDVSLPRTPIFETDWPNVSSDARGRHAPILYGRPAKPIRPLLVDEDTSQGVYLVADGTYQTLDAVHEVWAEHRSTGVLTSLTLTTDYTVDLTACTITVVNAAYPHTTHRMLADVTGIDLHTAAAIIEDILTRFVAVPASDLDAAAFAQAATDAPELLAIYLTSPRTISSILMTAEPGQPSIERSVLGVLRVRPNGQWTFRIRSLAESSEGSAELGQYDFQTFRAEPSYEKAFARTVVFYAPQFGAGSVEDVRWTAELHDDLRTAFRIEQDDQAELYTYLRESADARALAQRYQIMAGGVRLTVQFAERAAKLYDRMVGDTVRVSYRPALSAAGFYEGEPFELSEIVKEIAPVLSVRGVLRDSVGLTGGYGSRTWLWAPDDAPADWDAANTLERQTYGFWADDDGRIDADDPATEDVKVWL